jgi:hypothetical protein
VTACDIVGHRLFTLIRRQPYLVRNKHNINIGLYSINRASDDSRDDASDDDKKAESEFDHGGGLGVGPSNRLETGTIYINIGEVLGIRTLGHKTSAEYYAGAELGYEIYIWDVSITPANRLKAKRHLGMSRSGGLPRGAFSGGSSSKVCPTDDLTAMRKGQL